MRTDALDLTGRIALVTGGTRGIGAAIADELSARGAEVVIHGRESSPTARGPYRYAGVDLSQTDGADRLVAELGDLTRLDILVNNAGYEVEEESSSVSIDEWQRTFNVNLLAPVRLTGLLVDRLARATAPAVVNVTSIHERVAYPRHLAYSASKAALAMATRVFALELASRGIRVNAVAPGAIETDLNRETIDRVGRSTFTTTIPAARLGRGEDVAGAVAFLASDAAAYISGTTLYVDGAYSENIVRY